MNKITRYEAIEDWGMVNSVDGDFIFVEDLITWLHDHARHREIHNVYSDLFKALGVVNTVVGIADVSNHELNDSSEP